MTWETLFARAPEGVTVDDVRTALATRREGESSDGTGESR